MTVKRKVAIRSDVQVTKGMAKEIVSFFSLTYDPTVKAKAKRSIEERLLEAIITDIQSRPSRGRGVGGLTVKKTRLVCLDVGVNPDCAFQITITSTDFNKDVDEQPQNYNLWVYVT